MGTLVDRIAFLDEDTDSACNDGFLSFQELKADPGKPGVESVLRKVNKLIILRNLNLPDNLFRDVPPRVLKKYRQRVVTEDLHELRRHPDSIRYTRIHRFHSKACA